MTVDIKTSAAVSLNFDKVQGLRDLEDTALSLSAYCKAGSEIIKCLQDIPEANFQGIWSLSPFDARLQGHGANLSVLTKRIGNTIELVSAERCESCILKLIQIAFLIVCICPRLEKSVHRCGHQQPCLSTRREDNKRHNSCEVDHIFDLVLSARKFCCRESKDITCVD